MPKNQTFTSADRLVTLYCSRCKKQKKVPIHESDPDGTSRIQVSCEKCNPGGFDDVSYFNAEGNQLLVP